ncbi:hypothetical protein DPMN_047964 [Dreissena polymorpha]|uniref:HAT C-terminal dimerisation domain-containing protein n=1 Tax=Dreissena polymorpha TaxID=45954 RepID=A0A9D4DCE9_DREPO|nr:hypothetical protein DPMN_047964 [Dreissena polymorpha]
MYCDLCIKVQNSNTFTVGCNILKKDSVIPVPQIHSDIDTVSDYLGTVGIEGSQSELLCFANFTKASHNSGNKSVTDIHSAANLAIKSVHSYTASAEAAKRLLVSPVSTVDCERGFSRQNVIKTDLRNCLTVKNLEHLMKISIEGKDCKDVDFKVIYKLWAGKKHCRTIMK